jgi:hypothetical protein
MSETVIIVGAPRSGTNMLRDVLTQLPGLGTWNCDEINLLWKHGNVSVPHDELTVEHARPEVVRYLRRSFDRLAQRDKLDTVVEKTCATSLRVSFAAAVFPDAKFLFIRRDGIDAAASATQRWNAPLDLRYTLRKARYVPGSDFPRHLAAFAGRRLKQRADGTAGKADGEVRATTWWGPKPHDATTLQRRHTLDEIALIQWQRCVEASCRQLALLPNDRVHEIVYEDFVSDPTAGLEQILAFLGRSALMDRRATEIVKKSSIGRGRKALGPERVAKLEELGGDTLRAFGYA